MTVVLPLINRVNRWPRRWRWPLKWAALAATVFLVCFPDPRLFVRTMQRWRNPNALIEPDSPRLDELLTGLSGWREARHRRLESMYVSLAGVAATQPAAFSGPPRALAAPEAEEPQTLLRDVQEYVYQRIPYAFDWETWGSSDYLPTLDEVLDMGREDCDGRAVVAASLLARLGIKAELVADFAHVWVKTEFGDTMSPGTHTAVRATDEGVRVDWGWRLIASTTSALAYGLAVFPLTRQLIVLAVVMLLLVQPGSGWHRNTVAALLLVNGLLLLRAGGGQWQHNQLALQLFGIAQLLAGVILLLRCGPTPRTLTSSEVDPGLG